MIDYAKKLEEAKKEMEEHISNKVGKDRCGRWARRHMSIGKQIREDIKYYESKI